MTTAVLSCRICESTQPLAPRSSCSTCSGPLDVHYVNGRDSELARPRSELLPHGDAAMPAPTPLVPAPRLAAALGIDLHLKLETANPTGSFKDRMAASAVAAAQTFGLETVFCASTGNLGAAVAARCAAVGLEGVVVAPGEDAGVLAAVRGSTAFTVDGSVDDCRRLERELAQLFPRGFLDGNLHPFAVEGIKTIAHELAEQLDGLAPDAVVAPVGSGALVAKIAQGFAELADRGLLTGERPRLYGAQPSGCPPVAAAWADTRPPSPVLPATAARSLAVGDPTYGELALGAARMSGGAIAAVPEDAIGPTTELLAETTGVAADPAAGVALAALTQLVAGGAIREGERVVLVVTGRAKQQSRGGAVQIQPGAESYLAALGVG
jgi:threonine synthase